MTCPRGPTPTAFARVQDHLHAGNSYEVNLTYRLEQDSPLTPVEAYLRLRELNPAPYAGFLQHDLPGARGWLLSSSPERYALVTEDRMLETKPIKGTTPRADDPDEDERQRQELATHPKFRAENLMIVDLLRNDLSMVCEAGTVEVPVLMEVESYPVGAPAGLDGARPAPRRRLHARGAARAVPRRLDDRRAQAAHDGDHRGGRGRTARPVRRRVRLGLRQRLRRPRRGDPLADNDRRRQLHARHRRGDHRAVRRDRGVRRVALEGRAAAPRLDVS